MRAAGALLLLLTWGCTDLGDYRGNYVGTVVGTTDLGTTDSFIRRGFREGTVLTLSNFVPTAIDGTPVRGTLTTDETPERTFSGAQIRTIDALRHDQLGLYNFPGGERLRNYIFTCRPTTGPVAMRDTMVFVSLLDDDRLELRVIVGTGAPGDYFGLFVMDKQ